MMRVRTGMGTTLIAATVALVIASILVWDVTREGDAAVQRLLYGQHLIASAIAVGFSQRLAGLEATDDARRESERESLLLRMLPEARAIERDGHSVLLLKLPERAGLRTTDGGVVASPALERALESGERGMILSRDEASAIGLPHRVGVAAIARVADARGLPAIAIVMATSAREERDRFRNYEYRLAGGLALTALLVAGFIWLVLREQRRRLVTDATLERERVARERDEQLSRAERMASIAALSLGIGHELATPLGVILGRVEEIRQTTTDTSASRALGSIEDQVVRIRRVLESFLALARGEAPMMTSTRVSRIVDDATTLVRHRFANTGVALVTRISQDCSLRCDPALFAQVLVNLLINARAHSRPGGTVELDVSRIEASVVFTVLDSGAGIAPDVAGRATEPFFTTRRTEGGSGLGLTIAREIVQHHGGTLHISARAGGVGTTAQVTVPAEAMHG